MNGTRVGAVRALRPTVRRELLSRYTAPSALLGAGLLLAASGPRWLSLNNISLGAQLFTLIAVAQAWNLIGGFGGQFSLGHAMFIGVGSYTLALLLLHTTLPLTVTIFAAGLVAALLGALLGVPLLRLRGVNFAVGTLAAALILQAWVIIWGYAGKSQGLNLPTTAYVSFDAQYYSALAAAGVTTIIAGAIAASRFGLRLMAVRDDEDAAAGAGVFGFSVKFRAFVLSAFLTGIAGALFAIQNPFVEPTSAFALTWSINAIVACVIGGLATVVGPLLGVALTFVLSQELQTHAEWDNLILGLVMVAMILLAPEGLWGMIRRSVRRAGDELSKVTAVRSGGEREPHAG